MSKKMTLIATGSVLAFSLLAAASNAAPGGGGGSSTDSPAKDKMSPLTPKAKTNIKKSPKAKSCKRGQTSKRVKRNGKLVSICTKLKADILPDFELYQNARMLADEGEYEWALDHLRLMTNQNNEEVLNYIGYSNRKAGRLETGISYYHKALAINPNYVQAREYLGEAYVLAGRVDLAKAQLQEIAWRCGTDCDTYRALYDAIESPKN